MPLEGFAVEQACESYLLEKKVDGDTQQVLRMLIFDEDPWSVHDTGCHSNVRLVLFENERHGRSWIEVESSAREVVPNRNEDRNGRWDLRLKVEPYGRVFLHRLCWWLRTGRKNPRYGGDWRKFKTDSTKVDHGDGGKPHVIDWRLLGLQSSGKSASQGPRVAAIYWKERGSLRLVQKHTPVRKRPARR